jgi:Zn-dependent membrane protease YugP
MTGYDTAVRLLRANGVQDISVGRVRGTLSDHYHPAKKIVNLSEGVHGSDSVAAVAVAAHEIGHVMQKKNGYFPYVVRSVLVPITNIGSRLALLIFWLNVNGALCAINFKIAVFSCLDSELTAKHILKILSVSALEDYLTVFAQ